MSARKQKEIRKGYHQAGAIYWTKDMEVIIRRIRAQRNVYGVSCIIGICTIIFEALALLGVI